MMKITGLSHLFKWENLHNWWLTKYFFAPLYMVTTPPFINHMNVCPYRNHDKESSSDCEANLCSH